MISRRDVLKSAAIGAAFFFVPRLARADSGKLIQLTSRPANYESVRTTFTTRITPVDSFYIRGHFDTPRVGVTSWRLKVHGLVDKPLELSRADLEKMPQTTVEAVLQCAGNGRALFRPRMPGVQWQRGAMGNATWTGVRLRDILKLAGVKPDARHLQLRGADNPVLAQTPAFIRGIPIEKANHSDTLIALSMNGAPLNVHHGAPARVVVPGWVADDWVKWIVDVEVRADEPKGFFYETAYRFPTEPIQPGSAVPPEKMKPMTTMNVKSIIGSHDSGVIRAGDHEIVGVAFSNGTPVNRVELTFDGGKSWIDATLDAAPEPSLDGAHYGFRVFRHGWKASTGKYAIASRATDASGATQPDVPAWNPSGYLYNAIDPIMIEVRS